MESKLWREISKNIIPKNITMGNTADIRTVLADVTNQSILIDWQKVNLICSLLQLHTTTLAKYLGRAKRIWYLSPMRAAKVQASLRIRAVSPEPPLLAHTSSESRGTFRQKTRSLAPLNGWTCAVKVCHDGMLEDTNSLGAAHLSVQIKRINNVGPQFIETIFPNTEIILNTKYVAAVKLYPYPKQNHDER